jgi:hypothetical protein
VTTLFPDEEEEIPRPETCSFLADGTDAGLPASCHLCEKPGGCEAEDSMAEQGEEGEGKGEGEGEVGRGPGGLRQGTAAAAGEALTYLRELLGTWPVQTRKKNVIGTYSQ